MLDLVHRALARRLVGAIANDLRAMAETASREMIVGNLHDYLRIDRLPFAAPFRAPAAGTTRRIPGEARFLLQRFEFFGQRGSVACLEGRGETDVMQEAIVVVEAEQQRADYFRIGAVAKTSHHAIGCPDLLYLDHRRAFAGRVGRLDLFRNHAVEIATHLVEP